MKNLPIKKLIPFVVAVVLFVILSLGFMSPLLEGKKLSQADISRHIGMSKEIVDFRENTGEEALWTNSMFSGMPAYQISVRYKANLVKYFDNIMLYARMHSDAGSLSARMFISEPLFLSALIEIEKNIGVLERDLYRIEKRTKI